MVEMSKSGLFSSVLMMFIVVVVGMAFLSSSSDTTASLTDTFTVTNGSFVGVKDLNVSLLDSSSFDLVSVSAVRNSSGVTQTVLTQYNVSGDGIIVYTKNGTYNADYTYRSSSYISDGAARSITGLVKIFFALAVLLGAIGYVSWRELGFGK